MRSYHSHMFGCPHVCLEDIWMPAVHIQHKESMLCLTEGVSICSHTLGFPLYVWMAPCMFGCPHMFGHPQYVWMPHIFGCIPYMFGCPNMFGCPIFLDAPPVCWMPPYVWMPPYLDILLYVLMPPYV